IDFAGPGGDFTLFPTGDWFLDMVLSTNVGGWAFAAGTSMAARGIRGGSSHRGQARAHAPLAPRGRAPRLGGRPG
ncbi:MAG: hypothetical protein ACREF4_19070, partial [Gammaproteobacteria bacterium]